MAPTSRVIAASREDADDVGAALDFAVEALERVCRVQLGPMRGREGHVGEDVGFCLVHQGCELGDLGAELVGDAAPLRLGGLGKDRTMSHGGRRDGSGRKKSGTNRLDTKARQQAMESGISPLNYMLSIMRHPDSTA